MAFRVAVRFKNVTIAGVTEPLLSADSTLSVRWVDSFEDITDADWSACFAPPLEGRWWYAALQRSNLQDQFTFAYAVLERDKKVVGIAPTFLMDVPLDVIAPEKLAGLVQAVGKYVRFLRYQRTLFVGSPCSDEGSVGLAAGVSLADVAVLLQAALEAKAARSRASMIVWKDFVDHDKPTLSALAGKCGLFEVTSYPGTRVALPAGGFDGYLKSLKSSHRHNLKKKLRRGKQVLPTIASVVQRPDAATLAEVFSLFWQTYLKGKTKFERLNPGFFDRIAAEDTSHFVLIRSADDDRLVAFMLCFDCGSRVINKFIGIDYSIEDAFLYFQLWEAAVTWAGSRPFAEFQSGQTGYRAKLDVGHALVPLTNFCRHRNPLVHRIFAWQAKGISWETIDADLKVFVESRTK